jgi:excisionase family DNA binding protein
MEEYVTTTQASKRLGLSMAERYELIDRGELEAYAVGDDRLGREDRKLIRLLHSQVEARDRQERIRRGLARPR